MPAPILFDAYGTLFDVHSVTETAEDLFPGKGAELSQVWRVAQIDYTRLRSMSGRYADFAQVTRDALAFAAARLGVEFTEAAASSLMAAYDRLEPFPENPEVLRQLKEAGHTLGILTNGTPAMIAPVIDHAGMADLFDHVLSADSVGIYKTAAEVYDLGPAALGRPAGEIVFVSSNGWDACGATWYGYRTFWVNRLGGPLEQLGVRPKGEGRDLTGVPAFAAAAQ